MLFRLFSGFEMPTYLQLCEESSLNVVLVWRDRALYIEVSMLEIVWKCDSMYQKRHRSMLLILRKDKALIL